MRKKNYTLVEIGKMYEVSSKTAGTHHKKLKIDIPSTLIRIEALERKLDDLYGKFDSIIKVPRDFKCACCSSGMVVAGIQCTKCNKANWWGFFQQ